MKAVLFDQHGGPEVLKYTDAPDPIIRPNEVLVRVRACALNHLDLWVRRGNPNIPIPDRKSTRLNSSHSQISYAVFCLKKKNITTDGNANHRLIAACRIAFAWS